MFVLTQNNHYLSSNNNNFWYMTVKNSVCFTKLIVNEVTYQDLTIFQ